MSDSSIDTKNPSTKPIYKKWWFWMLILLALVILVTATSSDNPDENTSGNDTATGGLEYSDNPAREIEVTIRNRVKEKYEDANITKLLIFDETDNNADDYSVMVYLDWNRSNKSDTAKNILKTYSSDLAATLANESPNINKISIYWRIPYLMENGDKIGNGENYWIYTRNQDGMALEDENWIYE